MALAVRRNATPHQGVSGRIKTCLVGPDRCRTRRPELLVCGGRIFKLPLAFLERKLASRKGKENDGAATWPGTRRVPGMNSHTTPQVTLVSVWDVAAAWRSVRTASSSWRIRFSACCT